MIRFGSWNAAGPSVPRVSAGTTSIYAPRWRLAASILRQRLFATERLPPYNWAEKWRDLLLTTLAKTACRTVPPMRIPSRLKALTSILAAPLARLRSERQRWLRFEAPGWAISLGFHLLVIAAIATVTFGTRLGEGALRLTMKPDDDDGVEILQGRIEQLRFEGAAGDVSIGASAEPLEVAEPTAVPVAFAPTAVALSVTRTETLQDIALGRSDTDVTALTEVFTKSTPSKAKTAAEGVAAARDAGGAAEGLVASLAKDLEDGPIFVVWLLDASISLLEDRQTLARSLEPFYAANAPRNAGDAPLRSAVVAYGQGFQVVQPATASRQQTLKAIRDMPIDPSGTENLMTAIEFSVGHFRAAARGRMRLVVWTDESGDDSALLEPVIRLCKQSRVQVHVIGPSSVLGSDRGLQSYTDKSTGYNFLLPVVRGPDSAVPERLMLPYWFDVSADAGVYDGQLVADGMPWYGGALRERLLSGLGPYSLTRLALETGGAFTMLERPGDRNPFELTRMKGYFPTYSSVEDTLADIRRSPFRQAVFTAVQKTYEPVNLAPPRMRFFTEREAVYPFREYGVPYMKPTQFRRLLETRLNEQAAFIGKAAQVVEAALASFSDMDWEAAYAVEPARWQAWYDLTRGRLLLMSVRYREYLATCQLLARQDGLNPMTNEIQLIAGPQRLSEDSVIQQRVDEGTALLERCQENHPGTPWSLLAEWELENELGVNVIQTANPPPRPIVGVMPAMPSPTPPTISIPRL